MTSLLYPQNHDPSFGKIVERLLSSMGARVDANTGSVMRMVAEAFAREMATFYAMLELAHASGYLDTAEGAALDNVVALLGVRRARAGRLVGQVEFNRATPAPDDIAIPAGSRVTGASDSVTPVPIFETTVEAVLRRGEMSALVPVQEVDSNPDLVKATPAIDPGRLSVLVRPVLGIEAVTNPAPLRRNSEDESDASLRARARAALHEGERGTLEAIAAAAREQGVQKVTVREPEDGTPGVVEVIIGDVGFADRRRLEESIRNAKAAGVHVQIHYARTILFQPTFEVEPVDPNLDEAGFDSLRRELMERLAQFAAQLAVGELMSRRKLEAVLFGHPGVRALSDIRMMTFEKKADSAPAPEATRREHGANRDYRLGPLETAVIDPKQKPPLIGRLRPPVYKLSPTVALRPDDKRSTDEVRKAVHAAIDAFASNLDRDRVMVVQLAPLERVLKENAGIVELSSLVLTAQNGLAIKLDKPEASYSLESGARLTLGSCEIRRPS